MGLFSRKSKEEDGIIDMGDGKVAVSPERVEEIASQTLDLCMERYEEPVSAEVTEALERAVRERHPDPEPGRALVSFLASVAYMGYLARSCEDTLESVRSDTPLLADEVLTSIEDGDSTVDALSGVALAWCDFNEDPESRAGFDAIQGLAPIRDKVMEKTVLASPSMASQVGLAEEGELPVGVDPSEMVAVWRIGYLVRSVEQSLPDDVALVPDESRGTIVVDSMALEEATGVWGEEHPDATDEEIEQAVREIAQNPRLHIDTDNWPEDDGEAKYVIFEVDHAGRIVDQSD